MSGILQSKDEVSSLSNTSKRFTLAKISNFFQKYPISQTISKEKQTLRVCCVLFKSCFVIKFFYFRQQMPAVLCKGNCSAKRHQVVINAIGSEVWQTEFLPWSYINHTYSIMQLGFSGLQVCSQHYIRFADFLTLSLLARLFNEVLDY